MQLVLTKLVRPLRSGRHAGVKAGIRHDGTTMKVSCAEPGRRISSVRPLVASGGPGDVIGPAPRALVARLSQAVLFRDRIERSVHGGRIGLDVGLSAMESLPGLALAKDARERQSVSSAAGWERQ